MREEEEEEEENFTEDKVRKGRRRMIMRTWRKTKMQRFRKRRMGKCRRRFLKIVFSFPFLCLLKRF